jgi:hypothetical protein
MEVKVSIPVATHADYVRLTADCHFAIWADQGPVTRQGMYSLADDEVSFSASDGTTFTGRLSADRTALTVEDRVYTAITPDGEAVTGPRLKGTYRRDGLLDEWSKPIDNHITFTPDGRFQEQGFLYASLGSGVLPGGDPFFNPKHAGQGTYRITGSSLELTYPGGRQFRIRFEPSSGGLLFNTNHVFNRVPGC